jgi:uridine phosphorylase
MTPAFGRYGFRAGGDRAAGAAPLIERIDHAAPSIFRPENMLREARRQKGMVAGAVPSVCILDPDGDIVSYLRRHHSAAPSCHWACYHTTMWEATAAGVHCGVIGHVVGASFSVMVAEQLFASGCELVIGIASAGQITAVGPPPYHILIERALRDEGTSYHYLPPSAYVEADPSLVRLAVQAVGGSGQIVHRGATWTTDAPFRETAETIALRRREGILAVEMEAAALYAFAAACARPVICLAHVSNQLACIEGDFEKGEDNGARCSFDLVRAIATAWMRHPHAIDGPQVGAAAAAG